ncbi:AsmA family protein [Sphingomonas sp. J315]|uniref:AsmA family protein n=1 Tax=Sphingomonas sp. J315 TaxID=2898433 RepID=UPI0021ADEE2D|nr:AsmA family protein [Sphingomonas sp. J315]UUY01297.1 AsmA family protein [Sphingomonas sp. J315]
MADRDAPIVTADAEPVDPPETSEPAATQSGGDDDSPVEQRRWPRWMVITVRVIGGVLLALFIAWAILYITKGRFLKGTFERIVSSQTGREVRVAGDFQFYFNPINLKYVSEELTVSNPIWVGEGNFFAAKRIELNVATFSFLWGGRRINVLDLQSGAVDLRWDEAGRRNTWTFSEEKGEPLDIPLIRRAIVAESKLSYRDPKMALSADITIETVQATDDRFDEAIRFRGTGMARRTPFTLWGALLSPNATVAGGQNQLALRVEGAQTRADITGTLPEATQIEGADLKVDVRGGNLADLFSVAGVAVPDTRTYRLRSALTKAGDEWRFTGLRGTFGDSDLGGRLTVRMGEPRILLDAELATRTLDIVDVGPFIGYSPGASAAGAVTRMEGGRPHILPDAPLRIEALRNFDARLNWKVARVRAEQLPLSNVTLGLTLDDRLLTLSPLNFAMARGTVSSDIKINARNPAVLTDYDIRLSPTPIGVLLKGFGVEESGTSGTLSARVKMTGTGDSVRKSLAASNGRIAVILPRGSFWTRNIQLSELDIGTFIQKMFEGKLKEPVQINCGLIAFTVQRGIAAADPILIDTQKNVMLGRGGFSFRNETLDLAFRADSKKFSLFAGQSPVGIGGYFAQPKIDVITPELLGRAGAGLGLGVAASPLAGILAFVDVGDAKSAACGPVLAGATAKAQRDTKGRPRDDVGKGTTAKSEDGSRTRAERKEQRKKFLGIF